MTLFGKCVFGLLLLVIAGGVYYGVGSYLKKDAEMGVIVQATTTEDLPSVATTTQKITFKDFITKKGAYKCTIAETLSAKGTSTAVVYFQNASSKVEFNEKVKGDNGPLRILRHDDYIYSWIDNASTTKGYKTKTEDFGVATTTSAVAKMRILNWADVTEYSCDTWTVDEEVFALPSGIIFTEVK